jgi:photosystem II stability/assembly factor-like uncharacterized protein
MQSLIFFNKEGDNLNFRYNEDDERWEGDMIFHANSDDTFKTAGLYMFERIPSFEYEKPGDLFLQKFQLFNEYRFNITGCSYFNRPVTRVELPNNDQLFFSKWIYGNNFEKMFPIGTQIMFDKKYLEFTNINQSYTVVKTKKNGIMIMSNLDNRSFNSKYGSVIEGTASLEGISVSGVNSIGVYNYIDDQYKDNLSSWSEPDFYDKYYNGKVLNLFGTERNDGIYTVRNYLLNDKVYKRYELDAKSLTQSYDLLIDILLKTELPTVYTGGLYLTASRIYFTDGVPKILKPGVEFHLPNASINTNSLKILDVVKFEGINKLTYFATQSQVLYGNSLYECVLSHYWTATSSILPDNKTYWDAPTYLSVSGISDYEVFQSAEVQLTKNRFTYSFSFTQSMPVTLASSVEKYKEDFKFFLLDYYFENKKLHLDLLYPSNYVDAKILLSLDGVNYENRAVTKNIYEQNVEIEEVLLPEITENICENFSYNIVFTDIDEFGIRLTINGQVYYQEVEFIYDSLNVNMERTIDKTLRNWLTTWYIELSMTGIYPKLKFTGKDYSFYLNTIQLTTEYPNVELTFSVEVGTTADFYLQRAQIVFNNIGSYFVVTINDRNYGQKSSYFSNGKVDFASSLNEWVETYGDILEGYGIYAKSVLSMLTFDVKEIDTRFEVSVNTGVFSLPGNETYFIKNLFRGHLGAFLTSNEIILSGPSYSFEDENFATGQLVAINNSSRPWNNQEYNIEYLGPKDLVLSYQGPFWPTTDPLCNIAPFITIALSNGFGATGCTPAVLAKPNNGEFGLLDFSDAFSIRFGATNSYVINKNFPINDEAKFVDLIYLGLVNKIYVFGERLTVIDSVSGRVETEVKLPNFTSGISMTFNPYNNYLYCLSTDKIYLIDPLFPKLDHIINLSLPGKKCVVNPNNGDVYVAYNSTKFDIWYDNNFTSTPSKSYPSVPTNKRYYNFIYNASEKDIYVCSDDELLRFDGSSRNLQASISVPGLKNNFLYEPIRSSIYLFDTTRILNLNGGVVTPLNAPNITISPWLASPSGITNSTLRDVHFGSTASGFVVGDKGLVLKTTSAGENWGTQSSEITENLRSVYSTTYSTVWAVGEKNRVIRSLNGGLNWQTILGPAGPNTTLNSVRVIQNNLVLICSDDSRLHLWNGSAYQNVPLSQKPKAIWANDNGSVCFIVGENGLIVKYNAQLLTQSVQTTKSKLLSAHFKVSATSNVMVVGGENGSLLFTSNGTDWYTNFTGLTTSSINSIYFVPNTNIGWLVGGDGMIRKTTNNAVTWSRQTSPTTNNLNSVNFATSTFGIAVGNNGSILFTEDGSGWNAHTNLTSQNWTTYKLNSVYVSNPQVKNIVGDLGTILRSDATRFRRVRIVSVIGVFATQSYGLSNFIANQTSADTNVWGGGTGAVFNLSISSSGIVTINSYVNRGVNYVGGNKITVSGFNPSFPNDYIEFNVASTITEYYTVPTPSGIAANENLLAVHFSSNYGYAISDFGKIIRTADTGQSWQLIITPTNSKLSSVFFISVTIGWVGGTNGRIWKTVDFGNSWGLPVTVSTSTGDITSISFKDTSNGICCDSNGRFFTTINGGSSWSPVEFNFTDVNFVNDTTGWIVGNNGIMLKTTDGGNKWDYVYTGLSASLTSVDFADTTVGYLVGENGIIRKSEQSGINNSWIRQDKGSRNFNSIYMLDSNVGFVVGDSGALYKSEIDPPFVRNLLFNNLKNEIVLSTPEGISVFDLEGNQLAFGETPEYGPLALNQYDGDIYLASQNTQQLFVVDTDNYKIKHSETFFEGSIKEVLYNPDRQSIFAIIPNDIIQIQSLVEVQVILATSLQQNTLSTIEVGENNYGTLDPNYQKHPDIWLKTREYIRRPRENYNDEPFADLIFKWEDDQIPEIFLYDFSGEQLPVGGIYDYTGERPLPIVSLNRKPNTKLTRVALPEFQQTIFDELTYTLDHVDSVVDFTNKPTPIEVFIGMNGTNEGVLSSRLNLYKRESIKFTVYANATNSDVLSFSMGVNDEDGLYGMIAFDLNSKTNFRQDDDGVTRGLKPGQLLKITIKDDSNQKNKYISLNSGITVKILKVFTKYLVVTFIDRYFTNEFTQVDDYPTNGSTTYLTVSFEVVDKLIGTFEIKSQTEIEDVRFKIELANSGHLVDPYDTFIFKTYDINEQGIDWNFLNKKRKEMLLVRDQIFPYIGSYKAIINSINFFGYNDLELYEYYRNINISSPDFYKLFKVEIPDIFDNSVEGWKENDFIKHTLPNPNFEETNLFNLTYRITDKEGTNVLLYSLAEVIMKLQGLKMWLERKVIPITHRILDITGRADFVGVDTIQHRNYDTRIVNIKQSFSPIDFSLNEAYLMPINSGSTVYTCQVDFYMSLGLTQSEVPDYFTVRIKTYKTYKEWDPFFTYKLGDRVTYYDKIYESVIESNKLKNPLKYSGISSWNGNVNYLLGQFVEYKREIYQYIGTQSSFTIFGTVSTVSPFLDLQNRKSFSSWFYMTEWRLTDLVPVQNLLEYRLVATYSLEDNKPKIGERKKPIKAGHSYNFTIDANIDPFIYIEVSSDNGYGQTYTTKKTYEIRGLNDLSANKTEGDPIGPFVPVKTHKTLVGLASLPPDERIGAPGGGPEPGGPDRPGGSGGGG